MSAARIRPMAMARISLLSFSLLLVAPAWASSGAMAPADPTLEVAGAAAPVALTSELLHRLPRVTVATPASDHGAAATFEGVNLRDLLTEAKVPAGKAIRGEYLSWVVVVDASDGYRAVYALAELDPVFTDDPALVVDTRDGKSLALSAEEGPLRMLLPEEKRPARWVRQVKRIWVGPVGPPSPAPPAAPAKR
jgi:hypothetical protein